MEMWSTDEIVAAMRDIDQNGMSINAQADLFEFQKKFNEMVAEYRSSTEHEADKKECFIKAQKEFYLYAARISHFLLHSEDEMQIENENEVASVVLSDSEEKESDQQVPLTYAQCQYILQPVLELEAEKLTAKTMKEISMAVKKVIANANEERFNIKQWEQPILMMVHSKFDATTKVIWEFQTQMTIPTFESLEAFLRARAPMVQVELRNQVPASQEQGENEPRRRQIWCPYCKSAAHTIFKCDLFDSLIIKAKTEFLQREGRCLNCLTNHGRNPCQSGLCRTCDQPHNSLLCRRNPKNQG